MSVQTAERVSFKDTSDNVIYQRHLIAYEEAKKYVKGEVLEVGCGEGYGVEILAPLSKKYTAIDKFETNLKGLIPEGCDVEFQQMTVPPITGINDDTFDTLVSFQVIEHIEDDEGFVKELHRVVKKGGKAIITTPNIKMSLTRNPWHVREYTHHQLFSLLQKYFEEVEMLGLFGNHKVMKYYENNKKSVEKLTRFDIFDLQHRLPRRILQVPYDLLNRWNRRKLEKSGGGLVTDIEMTDYFYKKADDACLDFLCIATK